MGVKYEMSVPINQYTKDGQAKTNWLRVGRVIESQGGGVSAKFDCVPTTMIDKDGNQVPWNGWVQLFEPRDRSEAPEQKQAAPDPVSDDLTDDIPF